jgi:hypothetical protein
MEERERDCDEAVLRRGSQPADYARGIIQVCNTYIKTELPCASGISGSNLKNRVREIMTWRGSLPVTLRGKVILVSAAIAAVSVPFAIGVLRAHAQPSVSTAQPPTSLAAKVEVGSISPEISPTMPTRKLRMFWQLWASIRRRYCSRLSAAPIRPIRRKFAMHLPRQPIFRESPAVSHWTPRAMPSSRRSFFR